MKNIKKYEDYRIEEGVVRDSILTLSTFLSLGLSKLDAQQLQNNQKALSVIDTCQKYNKSVVLNHHDDIGDQNLKNNIMGKVENPDLFMKNYVRILPDKTIVISPDFIKGLQLNVNPESHAVSFHYTVKF